MPTDPSQILVQATNLSVERFCGAPENRSVAITFTSRGRRDRHGQGFAGEFLLRNGFDVIAFKLTDDTWYQGIADQQLAAVRDAAAPYASRVTFGSSMGAYAAIRFARALNADRVLALSPLFDIRWPSDRRYEADRPAILGEMMTAAMISASCDYFIAFDPSGPDLHHVEAYAAIVPQHRMTRIALPYSGHPSGFFLLETGCLGDMTLSVLASGCRPEPRWKAQRQRSATYLYTLSERCVIARWWRVAHKLNAKAVAIRPNKAEFQWQRSKIAMALGDLTEALAGARQALDCAPDSLPILAHAASVFLDARLMPDARRIVEKGLSISPDNHHFRILQQRTEGIAQLLAQDGTSGRLNHAAMPGAPLT